MLIISGPRTNRHLDMDAVVFRRASDDSLPDNRVIWELERRGESRAAAVHRIAALVVAELWERLKEASEARGSGKVPAAESGFEIRNETLVRRRIICKLINAICN